MADRFLSFVMSYAEHFISYRRDVSEKARQYASGLMQAGSRKNIYAISEVVPDTDERNLQQFITHSKWSAREVLDHVARDADELIGDTRTPHSLSMRVGLPNKARCLSVPVVNISGDWVRSIMDRWQSSEFWPRDVLPRPLIRGSTCPKNGPMISSDATKRASRMSNRSLRPKTDWLWKSLSRPVATECALAGWSRCGLWQWSGFSLCFGGCRPHLPRRCAQELRRLQT